MSHELSSFEKFLENLDVRHAQAHLRLARLTDIDSETASMVATGYSGLIVDINALLKSRLKNITPTDDYIVYQDSDNKFKVHKTDEKKLLPSLTLGNNVASIEANTEIPLYYQSGFRYRLQFEPLGTDSAAEVDDPTLLYYFNSRRRGDEVKGRYLKYELLASTVEEGPQHEYIREVKPRIMTATDFEAVGVTLVQMKKYASRIPNPAPLN